MTRPTRLLRRALIVACSCAAGAAAIAPVAAADDIPRPPGAIDNRGYELVSPPDKNRNPVFGPALMTSDGNKALFGIGGPTPGNPSGVYSVIVSTRSDDGWTTKDILPPIEQMPSRQYLLSAARADLTSVIASSLNGVGLGGSTRVALTQLDGNNGQDVLYRFPNFFGLSGIDVVASDDLRHLSVLVPADVDPSLPGNVPGVGNLYDFGGGTPELVGVIPSTGLAPACGIDPESFNFARAGQSRQSEHWASTNGSRVFFATAGDTCSDPLQLYVRDTETDTTTQVSGPPFGANTDNGISRFVQASSNGSWVVYLSPTSYSESDELDGNNADMDVYRWTAATGVNLCLTCTGESVDVLADASTDPTRRIAVSEDGTHVYFSSANRVAGAPTAADTTWPNTFLWRLGSPQIRFISRTNGVTANTTDGGYVTPNGGTLLFMSNFPGLDLLTGTSNGGTTQLYRYSRGEDNVTCVSCPPGGLATGDVSFTLAQGIGSIFAASRPTTDDGAMVFFTTNQALVPEDVNGKGDVYEWHDGVVGLITSGVTNYPGFNGPNVVGVSRDGRDLLFIDYARLTADAEDDHIKLYNARIGGGFPPPAIPPEPCHGDCRGPAATPPSLPDPGSGSRVDAGNATPGDAGSFRVARVTRRQRAMAARRGRLVLAVQVGGPGELEAFAQAKLGKRIRVVARETVTANEAGRLRVALRLSRAVRERLANGKRVGLVLAVSFEDALESRRLFVPLKQSAEGGASRAARRAADRATADGR